MDGNGVAADNLAGELFGEAEAKRGLAAGRRADEDDERFAGRCHHQTVSFFTIDATSPV
jgi:hypothetical protein